MNRTIILWAALLLGVDSGCASAQSRSFQQLTRELPQAASADALELTIQLTKTTPPGGASAASAGTTTSLSLLQQRAAFGGVRRERAPEISVNHLVVVAVDAAGKELDWRVVLNPSLVRAEVAGPDGVLTGRTIEQAQSELLVTIPNLSTASAVRIYRPVWDGRQYQLESLGAVDLGPTR